MTMIVLNFGVVSYWRGSWRILDLAFAAWFGEDHWKSILVLLVIGMLVQALSVVTGRLFLSRFIYRGAQRPRTWKEVAWRTAADRIVQYVMSWSAICIWKALWDLWMFYILPEQPWVSAVVAHVLGLVLLLLTLSFRSVVMPPLVYVEDSILRDSLGSRWNVLTTFLEERRHRKSMSPLEKKWEEFAMRV